MNKHITTWSNYHQWSSMAREINLFCYYNYLSFNLIDSIINILNKN